MENEYILKIKELMKDFSQYIFKDDDKSRKLVEICCPIEPDLMGYIFDKILGFSVKYRIFEKVNYFICFKYKHAIGTLGHYKLSYRLNIEENVKDEILKILEEVKVLIEKALLKYSEDAVKDNKYSLPNHFDLYKEKIDLLEKRITDIPNRLKKLKLKEKREHKRRKEEFHKITATHEFIKNQNNENVLITTSLGEFLERYWVLERDLEGELSYTIELYIENWFAFIEHIFSLLLPMTKYYNPNEEYSKYLMKDWRSKIEKIFSGNVLFEEDIKNLARIKELYRNRFSHGMFSREKKINVQITDFGMYPLWIGKNYCKGFKGAANILTIEIYEEVKRIFEKFYKKLKEEFPLQFNIIESGIPTFLDISLYAKAFNSLEENTKYIEAYWYYHDNQLNMDW